MIFLLFSKKVFVHILLIFDCHEVYDPIAIFWLCLLMFLRSSNVLVILIDLSTFEVEYGNSYLITTSSHNFIQAFNLPS